MKDQTNGETKLIVAPSDIDADMLYATKFWAGDPFIFLQQNGKRTVVLTDLEMGRGKRTAKVDEFVSFNQLEREVQGKSKQAPPFEKVMAHFLRKRCVKSATVPGNFPLGYARELQDIDLSTSNGLFWPEREAKTDEELKLIGRALRITETGLKRAMEVLKASKPKGKKLIWSGKPLTSELLRAEIEVLGMVARHKMCLATGHLSRDEIFAVVDAAVDAGVETIVVTHPEFPSQDLSVDDQSALANKGALLERCFTTPHTGKVTWEQWIENIRATGPERSVLSTDLGQVFNPPVEDGMPLMVDRLLDAGLGEEEIYVMAVVNTRLVAGAEAL